MHTQLCWDDECYSLIIQIHSLHVISEAKDVGRLRSFHLIITWRHLDVKKIPDHFQRHGQRIHASWRGVRGRISLLGELTSKEPPQGKASATSIRD